MPTNKNFTYKNEFYNSLNSSNTYYPERDVALVAPSLPLPPTTKTTTAIYSNESHQNTLNRTTENVYPPNQPDTVGPNQTYFYKKEVNETKNNVYGRPRSPVPVNTTTSLYERNVNNNTTRNVYHPPGGIPVYPNNANLPPHHQPGTKQSYLYKKETTNTTNTAYEPSNGREYLPHDRYITELPPPTPPSSSHPTEPTTNKYYKYSSTTSTTNAHNRPEREPLLAPFPTDGVQQHQQQHHQHPTQVDSPPKHLGQLLASFDEVYTTHTHCLNFIITIQTRFYAT